MVTAGLNVVRGGWAVLAMECSHGDGDRLGLHERLLWTVSILRSVVVGLAFANKKRVQRVYRQTSAEQGALEQRW